MTLIDELRWRGLLHDITPEAEKLLNEQKITLYHGIDPSADSAQVGNLVGILMMKRFQNAGHKPIALIGGATGMIGDPGGKSEERNLLNEETLRKNQAGIGKQLAHLMDFNSNEPNAAILVNNYDWMKEFSFLQFIRDIGKHITINYMMAKDSVKNRIGEGASGMSFTEFSYQLLQAYDFLHLNRLHNCVLQMGGSDQWGNITTGTELVRRIDGKSVHALSWPLITKADGTKFGKSAGNAIWLDRNKTSPYAFFQFWLNTADADAERYIKIFSFLTVNEIKTLIAEHQQAPHLRKLQKELAKELTIMVHSVEDYEQAVTTSQILFSDNVLQQLKNCSQTTINELFNNNNLKFNLPKTLLNNGVNVVDLLTEHAPVFTSKSDARRAIQANSLFINQQPVTDIAQVINNTHIVANFILIQKGKRNYALLWIE